VYHTPIAAHRPASTRSRDGSPRCRSNGAEGQRSAGGQIVSLRKKRADLYAQITAQSDREVRWGAQRRGVSVVVRGVVARAGGVDLASAAMKDIESLHE